MEYEINDICNYYGILTVKEEDGKFFWSIHDHYDEHNWHEISETLYVELLKYQGIEYEGCKPCPEK